MRWFSAGFGLVVAATAMLSLGACQNGGGDGDSGAPIYDEIPEDSAARIFAQELCRLQFETCMCEDLFFDYPGCLSAYESEMQSAFDEAIAAGLVFTPECMGEFVNLMTQDLQCQTQTQLTENPLVAAEFNQPSCKVVHGEDQEGEACTSYPVALGDSCAQGFRCLGMCFPDTPPATYRELGETCEPGDVCAQGSFCDATIDMPGTCVSYPGEGEACQFANTCAAGFYCDEDNMICVGPSAEGEPCDEFTRPCAEGLYCLWPDDICLVATPLGEPCGSDEQCGKGNVCDETNFDNMDVCQPEQALLCF